MQDENNTLKTRIEFARGEYGEILPPFTLVRLLEILANNCQNDLEAALYQAVMFEHQPLAIPAASENVCTGPHPPTCMHIASLAGRRPWQGPYDCNSRARRL